MKKIIHSNLDGCNDKLLAAVDVTRLIARGIQHIADGLNKLHEQDAMGAAFTMTSIDDIPLIVMDAVRPMALCPSCKSVIPLKFDKQYQFLNAAIAYLVRHGKFSEKTVSVPTIEEIIEAMDKEGMWLEFEINCCHCGFEDYAFITERNHLDTAKVPKLTK